MPLPAASRQFLAAALVHLGVASALLAGGPPVGALAGRWDLLLWLLLIGGVGFATSGFALHLFPTIARRPPPSERGTHLAFVLAEGAVVAGGLGLASFLGSTPARLLFLGGAGCFAVAEGWIVTLLAREFLAPRRTASGAEPRAGDAVTVPLFLASWLSAAGAGVLFALSGIGPGPGFGWWLAAVHLFVLGHVVLLVIAVSLRLVPRSLDAEPRPSLCSTVAGLGVAGALGVPVGMLEARPEHALLLAVLGLPEAVCVGLWLIVLASLVLHARVRRTEVGLQLAAIGFLSVGGALGVGMAFSSEFGPVELHALLNVLGFALLTILVVWFSMIAPFQRISHAWTHRMLWLLASVWIGGTVLLAGSAVATGSLAALGVAVAGAVLCAVVLAWEAGTITVLYPALRPLPGLSSEEIRRLRERWRQR